MEEPFAPAQKAHPALLVDDIEELAELISHKGFPVRWDEEFPGYRRFYTADGNGNRIEVLAAVK